MTRADLPPGTQACQALHAAVEFAFAFPALTARWHAESNTVVLLTVADEAYLTTTAAEARAVGLRVVTFHEPDLGGETTAAAFEPSAHRLLSHLPLALSRRKEVRT
ncbi:MAG: peptidyl-tRNA hydrolase [Acidimicrobiales bacterium]